MRCRSLAPFAVISLLAACSPSAPEAPKLALQPILFPDITGNKLYGSGCNFVASDGGMGAVAVTLPERAVIKVADHIVILTPEKTSPSLPQGAWTRYAGDKFRLSLTRDPGGKGRQEGVVSVFDATLAITDPTGAQLYTGRGSAQCKPM